MSPGRLPEAEGHGIVGLIITVMEIDQIMSPDVTLLSRIVQIGNIIELFAIVG